MRSVKPTQFVMGWRRRRSNDKGEQEEHEHEKGVEESDQVDCWPPERWK